MMKLIMKVDDEINYEVKEDFREFVRRYKYIFIENVDNTKGYT